MPLSSALIVSGLLLLTVTTATWAQEIPDTRGPVMNARMTVRADEQGIQAPGYKFPAPAPIIWTARWIASSAPGIPDSHDVLLRKEVDLDNEPKSVQVALSSGDYLLFVNGHQAARGPADAGHDYSGVSSNRKFYDMRDLTPLFHKGKNVVAAEIFDGDFILQGEITDSSGNTLPLQTDASWKGITCPFIKGAFPQDDVPVIGVDKKNKYFSFDATQELVGWQLAGFDDSTWPACHPTGGPGTPLAMSELPPLMEARYPLFTITHPTSTVTVPDQPFQEGHPVIFTGDGDFGVHFDKILAGRCSLKIKGVKDARLYICSNETDDPGGRIYAITLRDGIQYFETPDYYSLGTMRIAARGVTSPIEIQDARAVFVSQPVSYQGSFTCSDEQLNKLWKSCRWSTQICMQTLHLDSPQHQEPIGDYGDYVVEDLVNYCAMGDNLALARQDLRKFSWVLQNGKYQTFHTSYILLWLQALLNYYDETGDKDFLKELAPCVHGAIAQFITYIGKNGIISDAPNYMFMDWVNINGINCHHPPAVIGQGYMTALFYKALDDARRVSEATDDPGDAQKYQDLRKQIAEAYNRELWNADKGLYRDGKPFATSIKPSAWLPADTQMETFSAQNNALAVLYDLAPVAQQKAIITKLMTTTPLNVTPYFMHFVLSAVAHAGLFDQYGTAQMRNWKIVPETQTVLEMGTSGDHSHGWIATPAYQMSSHILGIMPGAPGWDVAIIRPNLCDLDFAKGAVPTPHGLIAVDWEKKDQKLHLKVTIPTGVRATIDFPSGSVKNPHITAAREAAPGQAPIGSTMTGISHIHQVGESVEMQLAPGAYNFDGPIPAP
jgi:alpha-L-rhamnosidase